MKDNKTKASTREGAGLLSMKGIYKASECSDIEDTVIAINLTWLVIKSYSNVGKLSKVAIRRLISLEKRLEQLKYNLNG